MLNFSLYMMYNYVVPSYYVFTEGEILACHTFSGVSILSIYLCSHDNLCSHACAHTAWIVNFICIMLCNSVNKIILISLSSTASNL